MSYEETVVICLQEVYTEDMYFLTWKHVESLNCCVLRYEGEQNRCTYGVTALDAFGDESKLKKIKIKL